MDPHPGPEWNLRSKPLGPVTMLLVIIILLLTSSTGRTTRPNSNMWSIFGRAQKSGVDKVQNKSSYAGIEDARETLMTVVKPVFQNPTIPPDLIPELQREIEKATPKHIENFIYTDRSSPERGMIHPPKTPYDNANNSFGGVSGRLPAKFGGANEPPPGTRTSASIVGAIVLISIISFLVIFIFIVRWLFN